MIYVTQSSLPTLDEYIEEIRDVWNTHHLTNMGSKHKELEKKLLDYMCADNIELMVNGHMALEMTIQAFNFEQGSEVITTPYTFASTTHAIVRNGLVPVFCDIDRDSYCINIKKIESLITDKTVAILPVHVYGNICDNDSILNTARKYGLKVIYDAAHAFGEYYNGQSIALYGDASVFSFHATKVFNSIEGGAVCFRDKSLKKKLYSLKNFGIEDEEKVLDVGANAKMNEFCAAMGLCNLRHIDVEIKKRQRIANRYIDGLVGVKGIKLNIPNRNLKSNYSYFPIVINSNEYRLNRDGLKRKLEEEGICSRKYFYPITSEFECYKNMYNINNTPVAKSISESVLTLPLYADLDDGIVDRIIKIIKNP